mgnify:CR=1 FL=1
MLDIRLMRENREKVLAAMATLGADDAPVELVLDLDERRRAIMTRVESLRAERNAGSKQVGALMREGRKDEAEALRARMTQIGEEISRLGPHRAVSPGVESEMLGMLLTVSPNWFSGMIE